MHDQIRAFLNAYKNAFNRLDGADIAGLYAEPSGIARNGKYTVWPTRLQVRENMEALCELYRARGYVEAAYELQTFIQQGEVYAIADLQWRIHWTGSEEPWTFRTTYNLVRTGEGWRIFLCTAYEEGALLDGADR
jgi:hypothetical protein